MNLVILPFLISYTVSFFFGAVQLIAAERHKVSQSTTTKALTVGKKEGKNHLWLQELILTNKETSQGLHCHRT